MKPARLTITVPKPCSENWDAMTLVDKGRFCASCQKMVIDFSVLTDAEVLKIYKASIGPVCGRYKPTQLNREFIEVDRPNAFSIMLWQRVAASLLFFQTIITTAWAQTTRPDTKQHVLTIKGSQKAGKQALITGTVEDYLTREKLYGMLVQIEGTEIKGVTDKFGRFRLALPDSFTTPRFTVLVSYSDKAKKMPEGTVILSKEVNTADVSAGKEVAIYRYPNDDIAMVKIVAYKEPLVNGGGPAEWHQLTGEEIKPVPNDTIKKTFWQNVASPFQKKDKTK